MKLCTKNQRLLSMLLVLTMVVSLFSGLTINAEAADYETDEISLTLYGNQDYIKIETGSDVASIKNIVTNTDGSTTVVLDVKSEDCLFALGCRVPVDDDETANWGNYYYILYVNYVKMDYCGQTKKVTVPMPYYDRISRNNTDGDYIIDDDLDVHLEIDGTDLTGTTCCNIENIEEEEGSASFSVTALKPGTHTCVGYRYDALHTLNTVMSDGEWAEPVLPYYFEWYAYTLVVSTPKYNPTVDMFDISNITAEYDGNAHYVSAALCDEYDGLGDYTVSYCDADGNVVEHPTAAGTYTINIAIEEGENYSAAELNDDSWTLTITEPAQTAQGLSFASSEILMTVGDDAFTNSLTGAMTDVTYSSSDEAVATVDADGQVTITGAGTATITAAAEETDDYFAATASYTLNVSKADQNLAFYETELSKTTTDNTFTNVLSGAMTGVTYSSSDDSVATVNADGQVTIAGAGTAIITANAEEDCNYNAASASYTLAVDYPIIYHAPVQAVEGKDGNIEYWEKNGVKYSDEACTTQITDVTAHYVSDDSFHWTWCKETATGNVWSAYYTTTCANCGESILTDANKAPIVTTTEDNARVTHTASVTIDGVTYTSVKTEEKNYTITLNGEAKEGYSYGQYVTLVGPDANTKYDWTMDGKVVLTNSRTYSFYVTDNTVITTSAATESMASVSFTATNRVTYDTTNGYTRVKYTLRWTLPDGCTMVGAGIKRAYGSAYNTALTADQLTTNNKTGLRTQNGTYTYTLNMSAATSQKSVNAMGYVTYKDASGETKTVTSDIITTNGNHTHTWDAGVETTPATCVDAGEMTYTCSGCSETKTETIPATGEHNYSSVITRDATCGTAGIKTYTCSVCGDSYTEEIPATGEHNYEADTSGEHYTVDGFTTYTCTTCGDSYVRLAKDETNGVEVKMTEDGVMTVSGEGSMANFVSSSNITAWDAVKDQITGVIIEEGITDICNYAFIDFSNLTSVDISNTVTNIGDCAFANCVNLTSVDIPDSVTSIGKNAFASCTNLTELTIPNSVTTLGQQFISYTGITSLTIPGNVTSAKCAFQCSNIVSVTIEEGGLTSISAAMFAYCSNLTTIIIPTSVTSISGLAFQNCYKLADVYYMGTEDQWNEIKIGNTSLNRYFLAATVHYNYDPTSAN